MALLEVRNVKKVYTAKLGAVKVQALSDVNFSLPFTAILISDV